MFALLSSCVEGQKKSCEFNSGVEAPISFGDKFYHAVLDMYVLACVILCLALIELIQQVQTLTSLTRARGAACLATQP
jgi:hypothetical protein